MKLKYKKMIIMISMCTMGIGMVTFSMNSESKEITTEVESLSMKRTADISENSEDGDVYSVFAAAAAAAMVTPVPTEAPVVEAANPLIQNTNEEITTLINDYMKAKLTHEAANFKGIVNDLSLIDGKTLKRKTKYIDQYENLTCYTKKGPEEGSYIVYACHEVKIIDIETFAPAMDEFYVKTDENGKLFVYMGEIDDATGQYLDEARESEDVLNLIYSVNEKLAKARESDPVLDEFNKKLEEATKNVTKKD